MTAPVAVRRVTVVAPTARIDVSLPAQTTVAELVPALVRMTEGDKSGTGWRLGRLGAEAFDASATVAGIGVRDGEVLFLNPRALADTRVVVDDIADTVAAAATPRLNWRAAHARAIGLAAIVVAFGGAAVAVGLAAPAYPTTTTVTGLLAVGLLFLATIVGRVERDPAAAAALVTAGAASVAVAGAGLVAGDGDGHLQVGANAIGVGCLGLAAYVMLAAVATGAHRGWFLAAGFAALTGFAAALATGTGVRPESVAAVVAAGGLALTPVLPITALRLSRLGLPRVPADASGFQVEEPPVNRVEVTANTRTATNVLTALLAAVATVTVGAAVVLLAAGTTSARVLAAVAGLALLLRSRAYRSVGARVALVTGGATVLALTAVSLARGGSWLLPVAGGAALGIAGLAYALRAPRNNPSPYWGRFLEVVEFFALVSLVPLAAAVLDLYQRARSLA